MPVRQTHGFEFALVLLAASRVHSKCVTELRVLPVSQVILISMFISLGCAGLVTFAVLPHTNKTIDNRQARCNCRSDHHGLKPWCITWSVFRLEEKRANEIA